MWSKKRSVGAKGGAHTANSQATRTATRVAASPAGRRATPDPARPASLGKPESSRRFSSIAWHVSWGFWWRRVLLWLAADAIMVLALLFVLLSSYARSLPDGALGSWHGLSWRPGSGIEITVTSNPRFGANEPPGLFDFDQTEMIVYQYGDELETFPIGRDIIAAWPAFLMLGLIEFGSLFDVFSDTRRVRRNLQPLNDLAVRAEILGNMDLTSADKIESLEQAIERASVDSPQVVTGDKDLASIEIALNTLLRQMQEAKIQQMRFVSDASHELRTPIAVVQGYVNMLDRWGKDDPEVLEESINALKAEGEHMQELVEQLLFLARGDSGRNTITRVPVNLAALVAEVWEEYTMIDAAHVYVLAFDEATCSVDPRFEAKVDVAMIKQSMRIIIQNAAKYSSEGSEIRLGVESDGATVAYFVQDAGIGMDADEARHVFERFWRAYAARETGASGSGLGLSIAKWIVDAHAGSIDLVSREGVGTRFIVRIPR